MSSEFYSSSLSRNLVRTGGAGYRENASLRLLLGKAEETAERVDYYRGDFSRQTRMARSLLSAGRIRLTNPAVEKNPLSGPPSP
jgi:hypothetical protein